MNEFVLFLDKLSYKEMFQFREEVISSCGIARSTFYNWSRGRTVPKRYFQLRINKIAFDFFNKTIYK